jgi:hypothetical protein
MRVRDLPGENAMSQSRQGQMWLTLIQYSMNLAAILRRPCLILFVIFCSVVSIPAFAANVSYKVNQVIKPGNIDITYTDPATGMEVNKTVPVMNGDMPAMVAARIVAAIPGAMIDPADNTKIIIPGNIAKSISGSPNGTIKATMDVQKPPAPPPPNNQPEAYLIISPAPSGSDLLGVDSVLSAGYVNGRGLVSYDATAGEDIAEITNGLNAALDTAGYATDDLGPGDILMLGQGAGSPLELDFSLQGDGTGDPGLFAGLDVVPEPPAWAVFLLPLLITLWLCRRRYLGAPLPGT